MTKTDAPDAAAPAGNDANGSVEEVSKVMRPRSAKSSYILILFYSTCITPPGLDGHEIGAPSLATYLLGITNHLHASNSCLNSYRTRRLSTPIPLPKSCPSL